MLNIFSCTGRRPEELMSWEGSVRASVRPLFFSRLRDNVHILADSFETWFASLLKLTLSKKENPSKTSLGKGPF